MEHVLNKSAYKAEYGNVIYDSSYPVQVKIMEMDSPEKEIKKGTVIAKDSDGELFILGSVNLDVTKEGEAFCVTAETIDFTGEIGKVTFPAYVSGKVDKNYLVTENDYELTDEDIHALRKNGIFIGESMK